MQEGSVLGGVVFDFGFKIFKYLLGFCSVFECFHAVGGKSEKESGGGGIAGGLDAVVGFGGADEEVVHVVCAFVVGAALGMGEEPGDLGGDFPGEGDPAGVVVGGVEVEKGAAEEGVVGEPGLKAGFSLAVASLCCVQPVL